MDKIMAASWWKYGLCVFGGLGVGYVVGVKITKNRAEEEIEQKIADIREIYRNDRRSKAPKKEEKKETESPEITTKTSIDTEKLSARRNKAEQAEKHYGQAFKPSEKPDINKRVSSEDPDPDELDEDWDQYIHVVPEFPEDSTHRQEVLMYYMDGVLAYQVSGQRLTDKEIRQYIGEDNLKMLEDDGCNKLYVQNDLYGIDYTILFSYDEWAKVIEEEPYKETL
jgi:hypothetical protein